MRGRLVASMAACAAPERVVMGDGSAGQLGDLLTCLNRRPTESPGDQVSGTLGQGRQRTAQLRGQVCGHLTGLLLPAR